MNEKRSKTYLLLCEKKTANSQLASEIILNVLNIRNTN